MNCDVGEVAVSYVEHGVGTAVLVLHGGGVDHREPEACFEPGLGVRDGFRRIYPDLPGMGRTPAPPSVQSADDVLDVLLGFVDQVVGAEPFLVVGHSAGAHYAYGLAARRPDEVAGLALVCPLLGDLRDVPAHAPVVAAPELGDEEFRGYFVIQTPEMLDRYQRYVEPAIGLADPVAMERIGGRWELSGVEDLAYARPVLVIAGRRDSVVGYAAAVDLLDVFPLATLAIIDDAGHALPHEQPELLAALLGRWLDRSSS